MFVFKYRKNRAVFAGTMNRVSVRLSDRWQSRYPAFFFTLDFLRVISPACNCVLIKVLIVQRKQCKQSVTHHGYREEIRQDGWREKNRWGGSEKGALRWSDTTAHAHIKVREMRWAEECVLLRLLLHTVVWSAVDDGWLCSVLCLSIGAGRRASCLLHNALETQLLWLARLCLHVMLVSLTR